MKKQKLISIILIILILILVGSIYTIKQNELNIAIDLLEEKFYLGMKLIYPGPPYFEWSEEDLFIEDYQYKEIINYNDICNEFLTSNAKNYLDQKGCCLVWIENKPYITEGGGGFSGFGGVKFKNINITKDTIEADAIQTRIDMDDKYIGEWKMKFKIKKIDDKWKIDTLADVEDIGVWQECN